jgi:hypothetical protein
MNLVVVLQSIDHGFDHSDQILDVNLLQLLHDQDYQHKLSTSPAVSRAKQHQDEDTQQHRHASRLEEVVRCQVSQQTIQI